MGYANELNPGYGQTIIRVLRRGFMLANLDTFHLTLVGAFGMLQIFLLVNSGMVLISFDWNMSHSLRNVYSWGFLVHVCVSGAFKNVFLASCLLFFLLPVLTL